jgi:hypothetical protein
LNKAYILPEQVCHGTVVIPFTMETPLASGSQVLGSAIQVQVPLIQTKNLYWHS